MNRREEIRRQLMATFQVELEERLTALNNGLLALEKSAGAAERETILADLFRAAHSLKGAARAVGIQDIEQLSHRLEDVLGAVRQGSSHLTAENFDRIFPVLDACREVMAAQLRGEIFPAERLQPLLSGLEEILAPSPEVEQSLETASWNEVNRPVSQEEPSRQSAAQPVQQKAPSPAAPPVSTGGSAHSSAARPAAAEDSIRVTTARLDQLMAEVGELLAARLRTEQRLSELRAIQQRSTQWRKSWMRIRPHFAHFQRQSKQTAGEAGQVSVLEVAPLVDFLTKNEEHLRGLDADSSALARRLKLDYHRISLLANNLQDLVRQMRMLPVDTLFEQFPRMVRDLARAMGKDVDLILEGGDTEVDRQVLETLKDPLMHLLRNAVDHGMETAETRAAAGKSARGCIRLQAVQKGSQILIRVSDDGPGIDPEALRNAAVQRGVYSAQDAENRSEAELFQLIFQPGFSTAGRVTDISGRGFGLDVVRERLEGLHGLVEVTSTPGRGTTFTLAVPLTLATIQVLLIKTGDQVLALPAAAVERITRLDVNTLGSIDGRPTLRIQGRLMPMASLSAILGQAETTPRPDQNRKPPVVVVGSVEKRAALQVDELLGAQEVVLKSLGFQLRRVRYFSGATILGSGQIALILNPADLVKAAHTSSAVLRTAKAASETAPLRRVLVADDSITTRTLVKNILESAGYQVVTAADGQEAWIAVQGQPFDALVTDVNMPGMDGFELTEHIRHHETLKNLKIVLVTSLESSQNKLRGLEVGADAYLVKSTFDHQVLLQTLEQLIR